MAYFDHIVDIEDSWSGPRHWSARPFAYAGNGYDDILDVFSGEIVKTWKGGSRNTARVVGHNREIAGKLLSQHALDDQIYNKLVTIIELVDLASARIIFAGIVRARNYSQLELELDLVEPSFSRSKKLGLPVSSEVWTRARDRDVSRPIPIPFGTVDEAELPQVAFNVFSRLTEAISSSTTVIEVYDVENYPSSGRLRLGTELVDYTGIDTTSRTFTGVTRGAGGTSAVPHEASETVVSVDEFVIAIDDAGKATAVRAAFAVGDDDEKFRLDDPAIDVRNGVTVAVWPETPLYRQPTGALSVVSVALTTNNGSNAAISAENALGLASGFTLAGFASLLFDKGPLRGIRSIAAIPRGNVRKILVEVLHSGDKTDAVSGFGFDTTIGVVDVLLGGTLLGQLVNDDVVDELFTEAGGQAEIFDRAKDGQASGPQAVTQQRHEFSDVVPNIIGGNPLVRLEAAGDLTKIIDGDDLTYARFSAGAAGFTGPQLNELNFIQPVVPSSVPGGANLTRIRWTYTHGLDSEASSTSQCTIEVRESLTLISAITAFQNLNNPLGTNRVIDSATDTALQTWITNGGAGRTVSELNNLRFIVTFTLASGTTINWAVGRSILELDYDWVAVQEKHNPLTNQYDVSAYVASWEDLLNAELVLRPDPASGTTLRVYRVGFQVIYDPVVLRPADRVLLDLTAGIQGRPAEIIEAFWTDPALGGNASGTINAAEFATAAVDQSAEGFNAAAIGGLVRDDELWDFITELARQTRLRVFVDTSVLRAYFVKDLVGIPAVGNVIVERDDLLSVPKAEGVDIEKALTNVVFVRYDQTDFRDYRQTREDEDAASISAYGEQKAELSNGYLRTATAALAIIQSLLEREANPYDVFRLDLNIDFRGIDLVADYIKLDLGWFSVDRFEIESIAEAFGSSVIRVIGRVL